MQSPTSPLGISTRTLTDTLGAHIAHLTRLRRSIQPPNGPLAGIPCVHYDAPTEHLGAFIKEFSNELAVIGTSINTISGIIALEVR